MITPSLMKQFFSFERRLKVLVIGDIIVDKYYYGTVSRISPEASIPVFKINSSELSPGGAANVAKNFLELGADVTLVGVVDKKENGNFIKNYFTPLVNCKLIQIDGISETKIRFIDSSYNLVGCRVDYSCSPLREETRKCLAAVVRQVLSKIASYDAVVISDYSKGCLCPEVVGELKKYPNNRYFIDCKPENVEKYSSLAKTIFKPNRKEFEKLGGKVDPSGLLDLEGSMFNQLNFQELVVTLGSQGLTIYDKATGNQYHIPSKRVPICNIIGAGDTVLAVYAYFRLIGLGCDSAGMLANIAASEAIKQPGTSVVNREDLIREVLGDPCVQKNILTKN